MKPKQLIGLGLGVGIALGGFTAIDAAEKVTVAGELIDAYCYVSMGATGENHRMCAIDCVKKGAAAGLLEDRTKKVYVLLPAKDRSPLPPAAIDKLGRKATVTGKTYTSGGTHFLTVESVQ